MAARRPPYAGQMSYKIAASYSVAKNGRATKHAAETSALAFNAAAAIASFCDALNYQVYKEGGKVINMTVSASIDHEAK